MPKIVSVDEAKEHLLNKDFLKVLDEEVFYHKRIKSSHISEAKMRKTLLMRANELEKPFRALKIKYINFKKLMTCKWSKEKYNHVLDKYDELLS